MRENDIKCRTEIRRKYVRKMQLNGLDHLNIAENQKKLYVYFLGKLPHGLTEKNARDHVFIEGGQRIRDIRITDIDLVHKDADDLDDFMVVHLDKRGDFSTYTLRLEDLEGIDSQYDHLHFNFLSGCPSDLDCRERAICPPLKHPEPEISYLAKDYSSFRQLILDRLSLIMPKWQERHIPDFAIALVELLAYTGDYLSYYQDAVATEAYLDTSRQRISVRRHVRLVDYLMHEGCNSRAWVCVESEDRTMLDPEDYFLASIEASPLASGHFLTEEELIAIPPDRYLVFEPLVKESREFYKSHNCIKIYTWCGEVCCLLKGATSATLKDCWAEEEESGQILPSEIQIQQYAIKKHPHEKHPHEEHSHERQHPPPLCERERCLHLSAGDVLIFEEVLGPGTGNSADADPNHRHAVRLTKVVPRIDDLTCQPIVDIEWAPEDALPFMLCLSSVGQPPECKLLENVSVARGNVVLVDYGRTIGPESLTLPDVDEVPAGCREIGEPNDPLIRQEMFRSHLKSFPVTHAVPFPEPNAASKVQARMLAKLLDRVLARIEELWKKARLGSCLSEEEIAEVRCIFGAKALEEVDLWFIETSKGRDSSCKKQARALKKLLGLKDVYLDRKRRRVDLLAKRARSGYLMGIAEISEIEAMFGVRFALELKRSADYTSARISTGQDPRMAYPCVSVKETKTGAVWTAKRDLLASDPLDRHFVAEMENDGHAVLRFGDGYQGEAPLAGVEMEAVYRIGNGQAGNVGREAISYVVFHVPGKNGIKCVRNPMPAVGGTDPEPLADVKLFAPGALCKDLQRAITTDDYALLVERDFEDRVQRAAAEMRWNGSWYEVHVAVDPRQTTEADDLLLNEVEGRLQRYRRIGHNLAVRPADYVPLDLEMIVCVLDNHDRGRVKADLLDLFSNRTLPDGRLGLFHPDNLTFGMGIRLSDLISAAQKVPGVETVVVTKLERLFEGPEHEIENGILVIGLMEVARLDNDPSFPENGRLALLMRGGL